MARANPIAVNAAPRKYGPDALGHKGDDEATQHGRFAERHADEESIPVRSTQAWRVGVIEWRAAEDEAEDQRADTDNGNDGCGGDITEISRARLQWQVGEYEGEEDDRSAEREEDAAQCGERI